MSLTDILATTDLRVIVDRRLRSRSESDRTQIAVKHLKADNPTDLLTKALALDETPLAAITSTGTVYILSPGTHGLICLQGSTANKAQKLAMEKLAKAYEEVTRQGLRDWYVPTVDPDTIVREHDPIVESGLEEPTTPVEADPPADAEPDTSDDPSA